MQTLTDLHNATPKYNNVTNTFNGVSTVENNTENMDAAEASARAEAEKKDPKYVAVSMFPALLETLRANCGDKPLGTYAQHVLADALGVTVPSSLRTRTKYATEEDKKNAAKKAAQDRGALVKYLMAEHRIRLAYEEGVAPKASDITTVREGRANGFPAAFELRA